MKAKVRAHWALASLAVCALAACGGEKTERDTSTPSGYTVPRYLVLKFDEVNVRSGPSEDHAKIGVYHAAGLPVQVIAETKDWRRICDPLGEIGWVAARMLDGKRAVVRMAPGAAAVRRSPRASAEKVTSIPEKARADLTRCEGDWCKVVAGGRTGWVAAGDVWGVAEGQQCAGLPAPGPVPPA